MAAPVVAIIAHDLKFFDHLPKLFPHNPDARNWFAGNAPFAEAAAFRNGSLQGAYFMLAARALGLDCGPMSGFDNAKVRSEEHTSELQSLMRNSYAVFCLTKKKKQTTKTNIMKCNNKRNTRIPTKHRTCHPTEYNKNYQHIQNSRTTHLILKITTE